MTTSRLTTSDLASVLSALDGRPRHPNTKEAAMAAIARSAAKLNRTFDEVLWLAEDLLDRRIDAADFRAALRNEEIVAGVC